MSESHRGTKKTAKALPTTTYQSTHQKTTPSTMAVHNFCPVYLSRCPIPRACADRQSTQKNSSLAPQLRRGFSTSGLRNGTHLLQTLWFYTNARLERLNLNPKPTQWGSHLEPKSKTKTAGLVRTAGPVDKPAFNTSALKPCRCSRFHILSEIGNVSNMSIGTGTTCLSCFRVIKLGCFGCIPFFSGSSTKIPGFLWGLKGSSGPF